MTIKKLPKIKNILFVSILLLTSFFASIFFADIFFNKNHDLRVFAEDEVEWKVEHYQQKLSFSDVFDENDYELFEFEIFMSEPNTTQTAVQKNYEGFEFNDIVSHNSAIIKEDGSTVIKLFYDRLKFDLIVIADEGFSGFLINNENISQNTFLFGEEVEITYSLNSHMVFLNYNAYKTEDIENSFEIIENTFQMPAFHLTINLQSELQKFAISIYKVFYENKTVYQTQLFSTLYVPYNSSANIVIPENTSYHLFSVEGKTFLSTNDNITFDGSTLKIVNALSDDDVYIYFERDFYQLVFSYGTNYNGDNFDGGRAELLDGENLFNKSVTDKICYASVYLGTDISVSFNAKSGYRFYDVLIEDENGYSSGYSSIENENGIITIKNITNNVFVKVIFFRTYLITADIQTIKIGSNLEKIAQIAFDVETPQYNKISRIVDEGYSVELNVFVDEQYSRAYEFKKWIITYDDGTEINYEEFLINQEENSSKIIVNGIKNNLNFTAIFGKKNVSVSISWNGLFGTVKTDVEGEQDVYVVEFGDDISFSLTAQDNMHFLKLLEMDATQGYFENENVFEIKFKEIDEQEDLDEESPTLQNKNTQNEQTNNITKQKEEQIKEMIGFTITNITENLVVRVDFVANTWWEHIEDHGLYGNGTEEIPYVIRNAEELSLLSYYVNNNIIAAPTTIDYDKAHYILATDIDCGHDYYYIPIGTESHPFNGIFDYNYYAIQNMFIENEDLEYLYDGVFYKLGDNAKIINQYRSYMLLLITFVLVIIIGLATFLIVLGIEKKVKPPKRIITIKEYMSRKNSANLKNFELSKINDNLAENIDDNISQTNNLENSSDNLVQNSKLIDNQTINEK